MHPAASMLYIFLWLVHIRRLVWDCVVQLKSGKKILKIESKWKTCFGGWLSWTSSFSTSLNSPLLMSDFPLQSSTFFSSTLLLPFRTAIAEIFVVCSRGGKTLHSTLSPGSGIHTIYRFPCQLLNQGLAWLLSAAALLTLQAKIRWQHEGWMLLALFRRSKQHELHKECCDRDPLPKLLTLCSLAKFTPCRYSLAVQNCPRQGLLTPAER